MKISKDLENSSINTIRFLSADAVQQANSGHPGLPMGTAAIAYTIKGVVIATTREEAEAAVRAAMVDLQFGDAGTTLVIEECLTDPEVSFFVLADGTRAMPLGSAQDHKRVFDGDRGPNSGGMGAFAPSPLMTPALEAEVMRTIVQPVIDGLQADGGYRGFLYVSLMLTPSGPKVIEFNVRFGDPETLVIWPLLTGPVAETLRAAARGDLSGCTVGLAPGACVGVVLAAPGYPSAPVTGQPITGAEGDLGPDVTVFHAGTAIRDGRLVAVGGRVLTVVARGSSHREAMARALLQLQRLRDAHAAALSHRPDGRGPAGAVRLAVLFDGRIDNLAEPRVYALYLRLRPWPSRDFDLQAGLVPPVFGCFARRRYALDNPLPSLPLAYQYLTTVREDALPANAEGLVAQRGRGWLVRYPIGDTAAGPGRPLVNAERWDAGVQARVGVRPLSLALAVTQGTLSHPELEDQNGGKQLSAPDDELGVFLGEPVVAAEAPRIDHAQQRVVAAPALGDVVEQGGGD